MSTRSVWIASSVQRHLGPWMVAVALVLASLLRSVVASTATQWTSYGPEGAVYALAVNPLTPTTLYAGRWAGDLYKSIDGGESWRPVKTWRRSNVGSLGALRSLALDPKTPSTIYAGTLGEGVFKSTDAGESWRPINAGLGELVTVYPQGAGGAAVKVESLAVDPQTPTTVYMRWASAPFETPSGVYKSTNAGASWIAINRGLPEKALGPSGGAVLALTIAPSAPTTLYLSLFWQKTSTYKTTDGGTTWFQTSSGLSAGTALVVDPHTPDIVYINGGPSRNGSGISKSTDGGKSWRPINTGLTNLKVFAIAIDPQTPTTLYAGTVEDHGQAQGGFLRVLMAAIPGVPSTTG